VENNAPTTCWLCRNPITESEQRKLLPTLGSYVHMDCYTRESAALNRDPDRVIS
jgi:hypothetical protein